MVATINPYAFAGQGESASPLSDGGFPSRFPLPVEEGVKRAPAHFVGGHRKILYNAPSCGMLSYACHAWSGSDNVMGASMEERV
jgi:hypothetical protein